MEWTSGRGRRVFIIGTIGLGFMLQALSQPVSLNIRKQDQQVIVSWPAGLSWVQPERSPNPTLGEWLPLGDATTAESVDDDASGGHAAYRLRFLAPTISQQPEARVVTVGEDVVLNIEATGTAPMTFQWRKDDVDLPGVRAR